VKRLATVLCLALCLGAAAQGQSSQATSATGGVNMRDNPYTTIVRQAKQVVLYLPKLTDGNLVNALKVASNLQVPVRVITTDDGVLMQNGLLLQLILLDLPVYRVSAGGEARQFMEVESDQGWAAYDLTSGQPVRGRMYDYNTFNLWYAANIRTLGTYNPDVTLAVWAKAFLGYTLTFTSIKMQRPASDGAPTFLLKALPPTNSKR